MGLSSFARSPLRSLGFGPADVVAETIATVTWPHVWSRLGTTRCDLLVVDTEGHDVRLLPAADLTRHRPRVIHFEHACVPRAEQIAFYCELFDLGYEIATCYQDTIARDAQAPSRP